MRVRWTRRASRDLDEIGAYIAADDPPAAESILTLIAESARRLSEFPMAGRTGRVPETRELVIAGTRYLVVYRVTHAEVAILAVLHGARQWPKAF